MEKEKNNQWIWLLVFISLTTASIVFSILCLFYSNVIFIQNNRAWLIAVAVGLLCVCCGVSFWFVFKGKDALTKTSISVYVFILFCLVLMFIFQKTGFFQLVNSSEGLQSYLEKSGAWMPILYIVLQYLQVILLPIPSVVSTVAGIALFGLLKTVAYSLIGILLGSVTGFFIGRKLGGKAAAWIVGEENLKTWRKKLKGKDNFVLTAMFLLPLFPDDVLCFIAGLSSMTTKYFLIMILITRTIGIFGTCYSFNFIPFDTWWGLLIWGVLIGAVVAAFILFSKYTDKVQAWWKSLKNRPKKD